MNRHFLSIIYEVTGTEFSIRINVRIKLNRLFDEYAFLPVGNVILGLILELK